MDLFETPSPDYSSMRCRRMTLPVEIRLNAVIVAITDETPRILTVSPGDLPRQVDAALVPHALPFGPLDTKADRTLELGLRRWVRERTGLELGYVEQLYTFGNLNREPAAPSRVISVAYLALIREEQRPADSESWWQDWYELLPWEDWRGGEPALIRGVIAPRLEHWAASSEEDVVRWRRFERASIAFGLQGSSWDSERVLERYELLYEARLVEEAVRDHLLQGELTSLDPARLIPSQPMAFDHRRIAASALGRIRGKLQYRPVIFELLPETFTLLRLQRVVEALAGARLHKQNFRRLVDRGGLVEGTGRLATQTGGRPAELFRFRREVLRERPAPGVSLPEPRR
jgi:hypothetical protein